MVGCFVLCVTQETLTSELTNTSIRIGTKLSRGLLLLLCYFYTPIIIVTA